MVHGPKGHALPFSQVRSGEPDEKWNSWDRISGAFWVFKWGGLASTALATGTYSAFSVTDCMFLALAQ